MPLLTPKPAGLHALNPGPCSTNPTSWTWAQNIHCPTTCPGFASPQGKSLVTRFTYLSLRGLGVPLGRSWRVLWTLPPQGTMLELGCDCAIVHKGMVTPPRSHPEGKLPLFPFLIQGNRDWELMQHLPKAASLVSTKANQTASTSKDRRCKEF